MHVGRLAGHDHRFAVDDLQSRQDKHVSKMKINKTIPPNSPSSYAYARLPANAPGEYHRGHLRPWSPCVCITYILASKADDDDDDVED